MTPQFLMRCVGLDVEIYDSFTGDANDGQTVFGPATFETASRRAADMNRAAAALLPVAPCCACERALRYLLPVLREVLPTVLHVDTGLLLREAIDRAVEMMEERDAL